MTAPEIDFAALYDQHATALRHRLTWIVGDRDAAEDLTHQAFERLMRWWKRGAWEERDRPVVALLYTIARNLAVDHFKSGAVRLTRPALFDVWDDGTRPPPPELIADDIADEIADADRAAYQRAILNGALSRLTPGQRRAVELRYLHGLPLAEVARLMDTNVPVIKSATVRARRMLARDPEVRHAAAA